MSRGRGRGGGRGTHPETVQQELDAVRHQLRRAALHQLEVAPRVPRGRQVPGPRGLRAQRKTVHHVQDALSSRLKNNASWSQNDEQTRLKTLHSRNFYGRW